MSEKSESKSGRRDVCFSTPWIEVLAIHPADGVGEPHYAVSSSDYVSVVALDPRGRVVCVRQFRPAIGAQSLELPAGHVDPGQTPEQAAAAELLEETGYQASSFELLGVMHPDTGRLTNRHWAFFASGLTQVPGSRPPDETAHPLDLSIGELQQAIVDGRFCHAQHLASLQLATMQGKFAFAGAATPPAVVTAGARKSGASAAFVRSASTEYDVCVVGGAGHVGLPLSIVMANSGMRVLVYDHDTATMRTISEGRMPFMEDGAEPLLAEALASGALKFTSDPSASRGTPNLIVTIGTPVDEFLNPDTAVIGRWTEGFLPHISDDQLIMLRSTVYPGTTTWLDGELRRLGRSPRLAFCPERIVQGQAIKELPTLPQIVAGTTPEAEEAAAAFWATIAPEIVRLSPVEAEFAKLFCNAYRYIQFAAANELFTVTTEAGVDFGRVVRGLKAHYPRMRDFPTAGFSAGPCLLKDTMQLAAFARNRFTLGHAAMQVNEGMVLWLVNELANEYDLASMKVGLLGMAFKADIDDIRASLSYKLKKSLRFQCREVLTADPFVTNDPELLPVDEVIARSDLLILCQPHSMWRGMDLGGKPLIDIWGAMQPDVGLA